MINKKIIIISLLILILMSVQCVSASDNTDINLIGDNGDYGVLKAPTETQTYTDLKNLIDNDNTGEITLEYNYKFNNGNDPKTGINITKDLVINGNGSTIDGQDASSLFNISSGVTVTLKNLTIIKAAYKEGYAADTFVAYPAITSKGVLNIQDCTFDSIKPAENWMDHVQNANGSVIYSTNDVNILDSTFSNNWVATSAIIYTTGCVSVKGSEFENNIAYGDDYKGAVIYTEGGIDLIEDCTFDSNGKDGKGSGGAIYIANESAVTSIKGSTFNDNHAINGSVIYTEGGIDLIEDCTFDSNGKNGVGYGGAIYIANESAVTSIKDSTFEYNFANTGGVIYTEGKIDAIEDSTFSGDMAIVGGVLYTKAVNTIDNSDFDNCGYYTDTSKGAIYITGSDDLTVTDSTFTMCNGGEGGAIYTHGGVSLTDCEITECTADSYQLITKGAVYADGDVYIERTLITDNFAGEGSAVYTNSSLTIKNCNNIQDNGLFVQHVTSRGGVFYAKGDVNIENTTFGANYANLAGGAVYSEGDITFYNSSVNGSEASKQNGDGGFIYAEGNIAVENSTVASIYMKVGDQIQSSYSGAVYAGGNITVRNSTFDGTNGNEDHSIGGAIRAEGNAVIYDSNFTNNRAQKYGALLVDGTLDIYNTNFINNTHGVAFGEGRTIVNNTNFINNTGGALLNGRVIGTNSTLNITNSNVLWTYGQSGTFNGTVFSEGNLYIENCTLNHNHAYAASSTGLVICTHSNATVINCEFYENAFSGQDCYGGDIYAGQNAYVLNSTFSNSTVYGGQGNTHGLVVYANDNITFINSSVDDVYSLNSEHGALSGNYVTVSNSNFTNVLGFKAHGAAIHANVANVSDSLFYNIDSTDNVDHGGAIYANNTYAYRNNFTYCHAGEGAAIFSENHTEAIENIFINNMAQFSGQAIFTTTGVIEYNVLLNNSDIQWGAACDVAFAGSTVDSLELNWWGLNEPFSIYGKDRAKTNVGHQGSGGDDFLPDTWVIMGFNLTDGDFNIGEGVNLTTTLNQYYNNTTSEGSKIHDLNHNIAKRTVIYKVNNQTADEQIGWFSHDTATIINQDYVLYSNNNFLKHNVSSTIDYQTLYLGVVQFYVNVTKTVTNLTPNVDDEITYTIKVNNTDTTNYSDPSAVIINPIKELNITITDKLDPRLKFVSANDTNYNPSTGEWFIENLAINGNISLNITVKVLKGGNITNYANVTKINDTVLTHPYGANVTIQVPLVYKLDVNKTVNKKEVVLGDTVTFTINVTNIGSGNLTTIVVNDTLPSGFKFISSDNPGYDNDTGLLIIDELKEEGSVVFHILAKTTAEGLLTNNVNATCNENQTLVKSSASVDVKPFVNLTVNKTVNVTAADVVLVGDKLNYTITVKNVGLSTATDVNVTDVVDTSLVEVVTGESSSGYGSVVANGWRIASLAPDAESTLYLVVKVIGNGTISNSVNVSCSENKTNVTNSSVDVDADPFVNLTVNKTVNVTEVVVGDKIKYTIVVANKGLSNATDVKVIDVVDTNFVEIDIAETSSGYDSSINGWVVSSLEAGKDTTLYLVVKVIANGTISNSVNVSCSENDTNVTNSSVDVDADPNSGLSITKYANVTQAVVGDLIEYTIIVNNNGLSDATDVKVWDILPTTVEYDSGAQDYNENTRNASWTIDKIEAGKSATVTFVVNVTAVGNITNTAFANSEENKTV
ncbi:MAG: DUF11 domain-containing protein, partial [Methanobrevibacter millerae]